MRPRPTPATPRPRSPRWSRSAPRPGRSPSSPPAAPPRAPPSSPSFRSSRVASVLLNASGCLDALTAPEVARSLDAFVTKTVTPLQRGGNAPVRIAETDVGMLNSIGLANPGRERFLAETLPRLRELGVPLWVSVGGFSATDYGETCAALADVGAIEL